MLERIILFDSGHEVWKEIEDIYGNSNDHSHHPETQGKNKVKDDDPHSIDELTHNLTSAISITKNVDPNYASFKMRVNDLYDIMAKRSKSDVNSILNILSCAL